MGELGSTRLVDAPVAPARTASHYTHRASTRRPVRVRRRATASISDLSKEDLESEGEALGSAVVEMLIIGTILS